MYFMNKNFENIMKKTTAINQSKSTNNIENKDNFIIKGSYLSKIKNTEKSELKHIDEVTSTCKHCHTNQFKTAEDWIFKHEQDPDIAFEEVDRQFGGHYLAQILVEMTHLKVHQQVQNSVYDSLVDRIFKLFDHTPASKQSSMIKEIGQLSGQSAINLQTHIGFFLLNKLYNSKNLHTCMQCTSNITTLLNSKNAPNLIIFLYEHEQSIAISLLATTLLGRGFEPRVVDYVITYISRIKGEAYAARVYMDATKEAYQLSQQKNDESAQQRMFIRMQEVSENVPASLLN